MYIKKIKLGNFRGFENAEIELGKLTFLTGENNSGKTSIIYSILSVLQSKEFPLRYSTNGEFVELGAYKNIVYRHRIDRIIELDFSIDEYVINTKWQEDPIRKTPQLYELEFIDQNGRLLTILKEYRKENKSTEGEIDKYAGGYTLSAKIYEPDNSLGEFVYKIGDHVLIEIKDSEIIAKNIDELINDAANTSFNTVFAGIQSIFRNFKDNLSYISSNRKLLERDFYVEPQSNYKIGLLGENFENQIIDWEIYKKPEFKKVKDIGRKLKLFHDVKSKLVSDGKYALIIKPYSKSVWSQISDVGDGIKQLLPLIVADIQKKENATFIFIQPEVELHPSVQADFASYIALQIKENNKRYIIETHSEFIFNRIRLEITKNKLDENDVKTYFLENNGNETLVHNVRFSKSGQILGAPKNFFETYELDTLKIFMEAE
jgi:predicted ATP-dependent endonuclease of OLD family